MVWLHPLPHIFPTPLISYYRKRDFLFAWRHLGIEIRRSGRPVLRAPSQKTPVGRGRPNFGFGFGFGDECGQMGDFRRTFGFGQKQSYHNRWTFGFEMLQLVNSVVAESRIQSLSCGGRECARRRESLASLCTDWLCKDNRRSWLRCLRLHLVLWTLIGWH